MTTVSFSEGELFTQALNSTPNSVCAVGSPLPG